MWSRVLWQVGRIPKIYFKTYPIFWNLSLFKINFVSICQPHHPPGVTWLLQAWRGCTLGLFSFWMFLCLAPTSHTWPVNINQVRGAALGLEGASVWNVRESRVCFASSWWLRLKLGSGSLRIPRVSCVLPLKSIMWIQHQGARELVQPWDRFMMPVSILPCRFP